MACASPQNFKKFTERMDDIIVKISISPKYRVFSTIPFGIALGDSTNLRCWPSISVGDSTILGIGHVSVLGLSQQMKRLHSTYTSKDYNNAKIHS